MARPNTKANAKDLRMNTRPDVLAARVHFRLHAPRAQRRHPYLVTRNGLIRSVPPLGAR
jgi:hypothetical protein